MTDNREELWLEGGAICYVYTDDYVEELEKKIELLALIIMDEYPEDDDRYQLAKGCLK